ncbi:MAG: cytochrome c oxidase assembly protein [Caldilineales bacterium]|nr:cytochrome c oxidase assembly protein [Caldilineales bacterium]
MQVLRELFTTWEWRPEVLALPLLLGILYLRGWRRLAQIERQRRRSLATPWRLLAYFSGLAILLTALLSGLDSFGALLFSVHMIQHLLIMMVAAPLIWLGDPYPFLLWGLPRRPRQRVAAFLAQPSPFRRGLTQITHPFLAWLFLVAAVWVWHDPFLYDLTLRSAWVHDLEHLHFFAAAMIFSWHVTAAAPRFHRPLSYLKRAGYVLAALPPTMILGVALSFASAPWYQHYVAVPRVWGVTVMADQMYGGVLMWVGGSMMYLLAALILAARHLAAEERRRGAAAAVQLRLRWQEQQG